MPGLELINAYVSIEADASAAKEKAAKDGVAAGKAYGAGMSKAIESAAERTKAKVKVEADTEKAEAKIEQFGKSLEKARRLEADAIGKVKVAQLQLTEAQGKYEKGSAKVLAAEERLAAAIRRRTEASSVTFDVEVDKAKAEASLADLQKRAAALDGDTIEMKADVDTDAFLAKMALLNAASRSAGGGMGIASTSALLLSPALIGVAAGAGAAAVALSGVVLGAAALGGSLAAGAGVAVAAFKPVSESVKLYDNLQDAIGTYGKESAQAVTAQKKLNAALGEMTPAGREAHRVMTTGLRPALGGLAKEAQKAALPGISKGLASLVPVVNRFKPLIADLGLRFGSMAEQAGRALNGPFWKRFQSFLTGSLPGWFTTATNVVGNFARGFASLFMGLAPTADDFAGSIERVSVKFRDWAGSGSPAAGFERFMNASRQILPQVVVFIRALWGAFSNVTVALAPLAPMMLGLVQSMATFIGGMDPAHVRGFAIAIGVWLGVMKLARGVIVLTTVATKAWMIAQRALNLVMRLNPIGLLVTALIALGAGLVLAWKKSETFRRIVTAAWNGIKSAAAAVVNWWKVTAWPALRNVFTWIGDKAKWLYNKVIRPVFLATKVVIGAVFSWLRNTAWPIVKTVFNWIGDKAKWLYRNVIKPYFGFIKTVIKAVFSWLRDTAWPVFKKVFTWIGDKAKWLYQKGIKAPFDWIKNKIRDVFVWFRDVGKASVARTLNGLKKLFTGAKDAIGKTWDKLRGLVKKPINVVIGFANKLIGGANALIPGKGPLKKIPQLANGGPLPAYAAGSIVRGPWRGPKADNVLGVSNSGVPVARVNPGEFITNVAATRSMERSYPGALDYINKTGRLPGFASGGEIPRFAKGGHTWPLIWNYIQKKFPGDVRMTSNYRPGSQSLRKSSHALGTAIDIGGSVSNIKKVMRHMARYGKNMRDLIYTPLWGSRMISDGRWINAPSFLQNTHRDHGHIGLLPGRGLNGGAASGVAGGDGGFFDWGSIIGKLGDWKKKVGSSWPAQLAIGVGSKMFNGIKDLASKAWEKAIGFLAPGDMGKNVASAGTTWGNKAIVQALAAKYGWGTGKQWAALDSIISRESSWNPNAANPNSSAKGLFQKMTSIHGPIESTVAGQAKWGLNYIKGRYGSPAAAWAFWLKNKHYADGGQVEPVTGAYAKGTMSAKAGLGLVGERGPELINFRGGERVYTTAESRQMVGGGFDYDRLADAMSGMQVVMDGRVVGDLVTARQAEKQRIRGRGYARSGKVLA